MALVKFRGKERTHITVGRGGSFDFADPQSAWDSISDSSITKPYLITLEPGIYEQEGQGSSLPAWHFSDKSDIAIWGSRSAILKKTGVLSGGVCAIGLDGGIAERIWLDGFTIINVLTGQAGQGQPPEGALYIGRENQAPTTLPYDDIHVVNMNILGSHDGLQIFGTVAPSGGPTVPPLLHVRGNYIASRHDAYTIKGGVILRSGWNQIIADSGSDFSGHLPSVNNWKTTGVHYNHAVGTHVDDAGRGEAFSTHTCEQITVITNGNIDDGGSQIWGVGILNYFGSSGMMSYPQEYNGCHVRVINRFDEDVSLFGIACDRARFAENEFRFNGGSIFVHNESTGSSSPDVVAGVDVRDGSSTPPECRLRINGTAILAINDKSPNTAYSLQCQDQAANVIKHSGMMSDEGLNTAGGGVITHVAPRTDSA